MKLKEGMFVKHFKGSNLIEKNIYQIISVNPKYTGTREDMEPVVVYSSYFQEGKTFVRELADLVEELSDEEKTIYKQNHRVEPLTLEESEYIKTNDFINAKLAYIEEHYGNKKGL